MGKTEKGKLILKVFEENQTLKFIISDDGAGIDSQRIKAIGLAKKMIDEDFAQSATEEELINLIFAPGFSTKEEVSEISGRGVGMDALKAEIDKLHGSVKVMTTVGQGTTFEITIPNQV